MYPALIELGSVPVANVARASLKYLSDLNIAQDGYRVADLNRLPVAQLSSVS